MASDQNNLKFDSNGFALECPSCGAPSNGLSKCQWCGTSIPFHKQDQERIVVNAPKNTTLNNITKGFSDAVYTISGIKI